MNKETDSTGELEFGLNKFDEIENDNEFCECINSEPSLYPDGKYRCNYCFKIWYR